MFSRDSAPRVPEDPRTQAPALAIPARPEAGVDVPMGEATPARPDVSRLAIIHSRNVRARLGD